MSINNDSISETDIDNQYDKLKKLMSELNEISVNFDSVIIAQDKTLTGKVFESDNNIHNWKYIKAKDIFIEKEKLLKIEVNDSA